MSTAAVGWFPQPVLRAASAAALGCFGSPAGSQIALLAAPAARGGVSLVFGAWSGRPSPLNRREGHLSAFLAERGSGRRRRTPLRLGFGAWSRASSVLLGTACVVVFATCVGLLLRRAHGSLVARCGPSGCLRGLLAVRSLSAASQAVFSS